jgi:hypothetical protein
MEALNLQRWELPAGELGQSAFSIWNTGEKMAAHGVEM